MSSSYGFLWLFMATLHRYSSNFPFIESNKHRFRIVTYVCPLVGKSMDLSHLYIGQLHLFNLYTKQFNGFISWTQQVNEFTSEIPECAIKWLSWHADSVIYFELLSKSSVNRRKENKPRPLSFVPVKIESFGEQNFLYHSWFLSASQSFKSLNLINNFLTTTVLLCSSETAFFDIAINYS
jgi:hypothetical protein